MTLDRLTELLDAYGAASARWPAAERADALALIEKSPEAQALVAEATALDDALSGIPAVPVSPALRARILLDAERLLRPAPQPVVHAPGWRNWIAQIWPGPVWQPATAFALSIALGGVMGLWGVDAAVATVDDDLIALIGDDGLSAIDLDAFDPAEEG
ncbi:MAG: hypothetical protein GC199_07135 [Alphaproteobacteria bacterium]|nr:hypothetical protein [Alphaproteobacteria bacterium]